MVVSDSVVPGSVVPDSVVPGVVAAAAVGALALAVAALVPGAPSALLIALLLGAAAANLLPRLAASTEAGAGAVIGPALRLGIILLGARGSVELVLAVGPPAFAVVAATMAAVLGFVWLAARRTRIAPTLAVLLGVGTAICGNTAIAAAAPLIGARRPEVGLAIATVTLFGTVALLVYPVAGVALGLDDRAFGIWAGAGVHDTSQVVATGFAFSPAAGELATIVKLGRNALMLPLLVLLAAVARQGGSGVPAARSTILLLAGYGAMVAANSLGLLPAAVVTAASVVSGAALAVAIAGVGLSLRFGELRAVGAPAVTVGLGAAVVGGVVALAATLALQP